MKVIISTISNTKRMNNIENIIAPEITTSEIIAPEIVTSDIITSEIVTSDIITSEIVTSDIITEQMSDLQNKTISELKEICKEKQIIGISNKNKQELIIKIQQKENILENIVLPVNSNGNNEVLEICKLPESLNIQKMNECINKYMASRVEYYQVKKRSPFIEDEFSEYFTAICTDGIEIGGGSCAMDVLTKNNEGIDAMCVIMNKKISNEKSIIQNFCSSGKELDILFKEKKHTEAVQLYSEQYLKKLQDVINNKKLKELYILAFISTNKDVFIVCFKININNIKNVSSGGFVSNKNVNIMINNFINCSFGNVKLYKNKRRLELRLSHNVLKNENVVKVYTMP